MPIARSNLMKLAGHIPEAAGLDDLCLEDLRSNNISPLAEVFYDPKATGEVGVLVEGDMLKGFIVRLPEGQTPGSHCGVRIKDDLVLTPLKELLKPEMPLKKFIPMLNQMGTDGASHRPSYQELKPQTELERMRESHAAQEADDKHVFKAFMKGLPIGLKAALQKYQSTLIAK